MSTYLAHSTCQHTWHTQRVNIPGTLNVSTYLAHSTCQHTWHTQRVNIPGTLNVSTYLAHSTCQHTWHTQRVNIPDTLNVSTYLAHSTCCKLTNKRRSEQLNLPSIHILSWLISILCHKTSFLWHAPSSQSFYFGEIIRVMRHICIFLTIFVHRQFSPDILKLRITQVDSIL